MTTVLRVWRHREVSSTTCAAAAAAALACAVSTIALLLLRARQQRRSVRSARAQHTGAADYGHGDGVDADIEFIDVAVSRFRAYVRRARARHEAPLLHALARLRHHVAATTAHSSGNSNNNNSNNSGGGNDGGVVQAVARAGDDASSGDATARTLAQHADELLTQYVCALDGAPVSERDDLKQQRKALVQQAHALAADIAPHLPPATIMGNSIARSRSKQRRSSAAAVTSSPFPRQQSRERHTRTAHGSHRCNSDSNSTPRAVVVLPPSLPTTTTMRLALSLHKDGEDNTSGPPADVPFTAPALAIPLPRLVPLRGSVDNEDADTSSSATSTTATVHSDGATMVTIARSAADALAATHTTVLAAADDDDDNDADADAVHDDGGDDRQKGDDCHDDDDVMAGKRVSSSDAAATAPDMMLHRVLVDGDEDKSERSSRAHGSSSSSAASVVVAASTVTAAAATDAVPMTTTTATMRRLRCVVALALLTSSEATARLMIASAECSHAMHCHMRAMHTLTQLQRRQRAASLHRCGGDGNHSNSASVGSDGSYRTRLDADVTATSPSVSRPYHCYSNDNNNGSSSCARTSASPLSSRTAAAAAAERAGTPSTLLSSPLLRQGRRRRQQQQPSQGECSSHTRHTHSRCEWCGCEDGDGVSAPTYCAVAQQTHAALRDARRRRKRTKKRAQALLRCGRTRDAVQLLRDAGLVHLQQCRSISHNNNTEDNNSNNSATPSQQTTRAVRARTTWLMSPSPPPSPPLLPSAHKHAL